MSRAAKKKLHGVPVEPGPTLIDGVPHTSVVVAHSRPFARACISLMCRRDGRDHWWKLNHKSIWVPDELIPAARAQVEEEARKRAEEEGRVGL